MRGRRNYDDPNYKRWRQAVRKRDGNKCRMPGCSSRRKLQAHHIQGWAKAPTLRYAVCNGITLCRECHERVNGKETYYAQTFLAILAQDKKDAKEKRR